MLQVGELRDGDGQNDAPQRLLRRYSSLATRKVVLPVTVGVFTTVLGAVLVSMLVNRDPDPEPIVNPEPILNWSVDGGKWILPLSIDEVEPFDSFPTWEEWEQAHGAVEHTFQRVTFTIQGASDRSIILTDLKVFLEERAAPLNGISISTRMGGDLDPRYFSVTLSRDDPTPVVESMVDDSNFDVEPVDFPFKISQSDPEQLVLFADASDCLCTWRARLEWIDSNGHEGSTTIPPSGEPALKLTPIAEGTPQYSWFEDAWERFE